MQVSEILALAATKLQEVDPKLAAVLQHFADTAVPAAYLHMFRHESGGKTYTMASCGESPPDPDPGYVWKNCLPLLDLSMPDDAELSDAIPELQRLVTEELQLPVTASNVQIRDTIRDLKSDVYVLGHQVTELAKQVRAACENNLRYTEFLRVTALELRLFRNSSGLGDKIGSILRQIDASI